MSTAEAEDLIAHLSGGLAPADRKAFRQAAENALATSPQCWGPGLVHRTVVSLWREYFRPATFADRRAAWDGGKRTLSKLVTEPSRDTRVRHPSRSMRIVK